MNKKSIFLRSFMSIRTYAILVAFAAILAILLFSAGCSGTAAKASCGELYAAYQDDAKQEIKNWNLR